MKTRMRCVFELVWQLSNLLSNHRVKSSEVVEELLGEDEGGHLYFASASKCGQQIFECPVVGGPEFPLLEGARPRHPCWKNPYLGFGPNHLYRCIVNVSTREPNFELIETGGNCCSSEFECACVVDFISNVN